MPELNEERIEKLDRSNAMFQKVPHWIITAFIIIYSLEISKKLNLITINILGLSFFFPKLMSGLIEIIGKRYNCFLMQHILVLLLEGWIYGRIMKILEICI